MWQILSKLTKIVCCCRDGENTKSTQLDDRLSTGALVEEIELKGDRLNYRLAVGTGPTTGWVFSSDISYLHYVLIYIYICMLILYNYNSYHFKHGFGSCIAGICFESKNLKGVTGSFYFFSSTSWFQTSKRGSPLVQFFLLSLDSSIAAQ